MRENTHQKYQWLTMLPLKKKGVQRERERERERERDQ